MNVNNRSIRGGDANVPSKDQVAAAIAAVRSRNQSNQLLQRRTLSSTGVNIDDSTVASHINNVRNGNTAVTANDATTAESGTTISLLQHSTSKLGLLHHRNYSFSSEISDGTAALSSVGNQRTSATKGDLGVYGQSGTVEGLGLPFLSRGAADGSNAYCDQASVTERVRALQSNNAIHKFSISGANSAANKMDLETVSMNEKSSIAGRKLSETSRAASTFLKYGVSPSIAQIRARRALNNYHNSNIYYSPSGAFSGVGGIHAINTAKPSSSPICIHSVTSPITPTSLLTSSTGISEVSTEASLTAENVDSETVKNVSLFIDSLHLKGGIVAGIIVGGAGCTRTKAGYSAVPTYGGRNGALPPTSPRNLSTTIASETSQVNRTKHSQSSPKLYPSLENARNMIASSPAMTTMKDPHLHVATDSHHSNSLTPGNIIYYPDSQVSNYSNEPPKQLTNPTNPLAVAKTPITSPPVMNGTSMNGPTPRIGNVSRLETFSPISNNSIGTTPSHSKFNVQISNEERGCVNSSLSNRGKSGKSKEFFSFSTESDDSSSDDSEENEHVPESTIIGIGAFIDSIKNKNEQRNVESTKLDDAASKYPDHTSQTKREFKLNSTVASANLEKQASDVDNTADAVNPETQEELDDFIRSMTVEKEARNCKSSLDKLELPQLIESEIQVALSKVESEEVSETMDTSGHEIKPQSLLNGHQAGTVASEAISKEIVEVITKKIKNVVKSGEPSLSLGGILQEANTLGLSLDIVTKIYKRERFKSASFDEDFMTEAIDEEFIEVLSSGQDALPPVKSLRTSSLSCQNVSQQWKSSEQNIVQPSISGEVEHEMKELSLLCERATALFVSASGDVPTQIASKPTESKLPETTDDRKVFDDDVKTIEEWTREFERRLKDAAKSANPSIKLAKILAEAKKKNLAVSHLVEVYKNERIALTEMAMPRQENEMSQKVEAADKDKSSLEGNLPDEDKNKEEKKTYEQDECCYGEESSQEDQAAQQHYWLKVSEAAESDLSVEKDNFLSYLVADDGVTLSENDAPSTRAERPKTSELEEEGNKNSFYDGDGGEGDTESELDVEDEDFAVPGLSNTQVRQLKKFVHKAEEIRETDMSPRNFFDDAIKQSQGHLKDTNTASCSPPRDNIEYKRRNSSKPLTEAMAEDVDAFFHRFSIKDGNTAIKTPKNLISPSQQSQISNKKSTRSLYLDYGASPEIRVNCSSLTDDDKPKTGNDSSSDDDDFDDTEDVGRKQVAELRPLESGDAEVFFMEEAALEVSFVQATEKEKRKARKRAMREKYLKKIEAQRKKTPTNKDKLPGNLGVWKSPWERNRMPIMSAGRSCNKNNPGDINGVAAAIAISKRKGRLTRRICLRSMEDRTEDHEGYFDIDFYSLYEATEVSVKDQDIDRAPWEFRDVRQRFLHEKSVESRNWFGTLELKRENDRVPFPVCRPKSFQQAVKNIPDPDEWNEDWYTTWKSRKDNPNNLITFVESGVVDELDKASDEESSLKSSYYGRKKRVVVEIGSLCPVRVKPGERLSMVHFDYVSSLRRSRWRKKYLKGTFPSV